MSIYAFADMNGRAKRIYASAKFPSKQSGNLFYDCEEEISLKFAEELPLRIEGFYSLVAFRPSHVLVSRDVLGGKPLYYDPKTLTFSSFKYYFDSEPLEVEPGEVVKIDYEGNVVGKRRFGFEDVFKRLDLSLEELMEIVEEALLNYDPGYACISFSGGLDSSLLASIYDLQLITVTASKEEREWVERAARMLGRDVEVYEFDEKVVLEVLPKVVSAIETTDPLQVSIAVPIYLSLRFAKDLGYDTVVFGQGADELFGGYRKYVEMDYETLDRVLLEDVKNIGRDNLVRDNKLAYSLQMKILTPYLQWDVIRAGISVPVEYKVRREGGEVVRKYFLRKIAEKYMPKELAYREKKAVQYSTKTSSILRRLAKREGKRLEEYLRSLEGEEDAKGFWG